MARPRPTPFGRIGHVRLEDGRTLGGGHAGAVVADFQGRFTGARRRQDDFDLPAGLDRLHRVQEQIEEGLAEERLVRLDQQRSFRLAQAMRFSSISGRSVRATSAATRVKSTGER